jgi:hypothetical protein
MLVLPVPWAKQAAPDHSHVSLLMYQLGPRGVAT